MENRLVLGIDNSMDYLSIAASIEDKIIEERHIRGKRTPSEILPLEVSGILETNGYSVDDIGLIVLTLGPGSFTGIRVGLAFCKGISSGRDIPIVGVSTLDVLAAQFIFMDGYYVFPVIDAKKGEVFNALYYIRDRMMERQTDYRSEKPEEAVKNIKTPCICFGSGVKLCEPFVTDKKDVILIKDSPARVSGEILIREGLKRDISTPDQTIRPIYGRRSEAEIKFNVVI